MWTEIQPGDRVSVRRHSPDGVLIFRYTTALLCGLIDAASPGFTFASPSCERFLVLALRAIALLFSAPYVPFAALEHFADEALPAAAGCFARCATLAPPDVVVRYPKIERELVRAAAAVGRCTRAAEAAGVLGVAVEVLTAGARSLSPVVGKCAIDGIRDAALGKPVTEGAADAIWAVALGGGKLAGDAAACLATVVRADRSALERAIAKAKDAAAEGKEAELAEAAEAVVADLSKAIERGEAQVAIAAIQNFLAVLRSGAVKKPSALFLLGPMR
jgi:hypothetical protein